VGLDDGAEVGQRCLACSAHPVDEHVCWLDVRVDQGPRIVQVCQCAAKLQDHAAQVRGAERARSREHPVQAFAVDRHHDGIVAPHFAHVDQGGEALLAGNGQQGMHFELKIRRRPGVRLELFQRVLWASGVAAHPRHQAKRTLAQQRRRSQRRQPNLAALLEEGHPPKQGEERQPPGRRVADS